MCFVLYAGTSMPMPRKEWHSEARNLCVEELTEHDRPIGGHFSKPAVQYVGSTSGCGCDFPYVMLQGGDRPWFDDGKRDLASESNETMNRAGLVNLLRETGEQTVELYGVWDGNFATRPAVREEILLTAILEPSFRFKEQGFYVVHVC